ncbi:hypothetical protein CYMTET_14976 [Cymbomonas tetramitiformis]|uniref:Uncharacterized protein n=1 Tax=Cymbomonas tetramitiformis TaxID=36881 RepID=A0AAE0GFI1_9CHLO|nr:hypothetical protein CYMTET_14976 [Cymbomonas tetramitiformis]
MLGEGVSAMGSGAILGDGEEMLGGEVVGCMGGSEGVLGKRGWVREMKGLQELDWGGKEVVAAERGASRAEVRGEVATVERVEKVTVATAGEVEVKVLEVKGAVEGSRAEQGREEGEARPREKKMVLATELVGERMKAEETEVEAAQNSARDHKQSHIKRAVRTAAEATWSQEVRALGRRPALRRVDMCHSDGLVRRRIC